MFDTTKMTIATHQILLAMGFFFEQCSILLLLCFIAGGAYGVIRLAVALNDGPCIAADALRLQPAFWESSSRREKYSRGSQHPEQAITRNLN